MKAYSIKMKRILVILGVLVCGVGCDNSDKVITNAIHTDTIKQVIQSTPKDTIKIFTKDFQAPIDIINLLQSNFLETTSGFLSNSEIKDKKFCKPKESGLFGHYHLFHKTILEHKGHKYQTQEYMGELIVFTTDNAKNWRQDSKNQTFVEIKLVNPFISVWDKIKVGTKESELNKFIGNNFSYKKGTWKVCELGDYLASFIILADTVNRIEIGKYCKQEIK